jgi:hypothetical protein
MCELKRRSLGISSPIGFLDWFFYEFGVRPEFPLGWVYLFRAGLRSHLL